MKFWGRKLLLSIIIMLMPLIAASIYACYVAEKDNFHIVTKGEAYRSAQMNGDELKRCIDSYHIRSIINLRGKIEEKWYAEETKVSAENEVKHYDLLLSAYREPTREEIRILTAIFKSAPHPILIHCQAGADRSGLVAAMWKVIVDKESKAEAGKQLSIWYGHLSLGPASAMDRFFEGWQPELTNDAIPKTFAQI